MTSDQIFLCIVIALVVIPIAARFVFVRYRHVFLVNEGDAGLLYHEGKFITTLTAGRYVRWGRNYRLSWADTRKTLLQVPGQEVLTADNMGVKVSVVLTTQLIDIATAVHSVDSHVTHIHTATQIALRAIVSAVTLEALLGQRVAIGAQLRELIAPQATAIGVKIHAVEVRDVMLPGELRKAFSETLKARQEGQAALERARGESAALRNLANAARLLEGHPALATLRWLQTLEASGGRQTLVMNDLGPLLATLKSRDANHTGTEPEET
jgi:regulator of protease activity HflC (stomatin/prohibitin superfamily)